MKQTLEDIIFENRNKEYGSYQLRKRYFVRLLLSFLISVTCILLFIFGYFWYLNSDGGETVYLLPSSYPNLKNTQGLLMDPKELATYLNDPETPKVPKADQVETQTADVLHNFEVAEEASPDTFKPPEEEESRVDGTTGLGKAADSTVFGGYLLGEGKGGGTGSNLDKFPEFPGGPDGVRRYIELTVVYPLQAIKQKINGIVIISFDVNKQGEVDNIQVERGVNPLLDREAIKAVGNMPRWKPGVRHGRPVTVKFVIPVRFMPIS